ncbi:synaptic vesicle VAT-1 family membrane protein [Mangrovitalea sediminis]|uniref:synaptic vesicle VAT-1 family membrane protein n=1 Tax=Mangrovitalea sediminis TaxID=1982043 RepID=UPI000BE4EE7B|nr:medium chain dehydrogenase/reductase family protein [Mangrovitalea sediminis]
MPNRRLIVPHAGGADVLRVETAAETMPESGQVIVDVRAAGLNFADVLARQGLYPDAPEFPACLGYEFSGVVSRVGKGVDASWHGREVLGLSRFNAQAEQVCVPLEHVFPKPGSMSFETAAALPVNYLTAWQLLVIMGALQPEDTVLIHNVGGGVGLAALDVAKHIGARTLGTASPGKHDFLRERGLDHPIDYRQGDWEEEVAKLTQRKGVELIIDPIGGSHLKRSYRALRSTGRLGMFGVSAASESGLMGKFRLAGVALGMPIFHPVGLMNGNKGVFGVNLGHLWDEVEKLQCWLQKLLEGYADGWVRPHVDAVFSFDEAADAHRHLEERKNIGKVVLVP